MDNRWSIVASIAPLRTNNASEIRPTTENSG
jgi:hypothetical protein